MQRVDLANLHSDLPSRRASSPTGKMGESAVYFLFQMSTHKTEAIDPVVAVRLDGVNCEESS
jgi:hypothetical protein